MRVIDTFEQPTEIPGSHQSFVWSGFIRTSAAIAGDVIQSQHTWLVNGGAVYLLVDIEEASPSGWNANVTLRPGAKNTLLPQIFLREALDVLAIQFDSAFELYPENIAGAASPKHRTSRNRPIVTQEDLHNAVIIGSRLRNDDPDFSRSLGWYRRGTSTQDEAMAYLGIWNALEVMAKKPHSNTQRKKLSVSEMIQLAFNVVWPKGWPFRDPDIEAWIKKHNEVRVDIAHGLIALTELELRQLMANLDTLRNVVGEYLSAVLYASFPNCKSKAREYLPNDF